MCETYKNLLIHTRHKERSIEMQLKQVIVQVTQSC